ncbi:MAG: phosphocholine cytidylyltransferase family protein [Firmicutes bacterium]|nr:phosphocholine cytidylyltransferase family protein [Bacillota bacterium]
MPLSRYEFELLTFIERNANTQLLIRDLSNQLCISEAQISRSLKALQEKDYLRTKPLTITEGGLAALEPYRVKKALILAAGFGSRMMPATADRPKPMVTVRGRRIIETLLDALISAGIRDITLVRGYKKESFDALIEKYPFVRLIDNDQYDKSNNISSVMLALDVLKGGCYLCEADLYISNPDIITRYQYTSNILGSYSLETDDWSFRMKDGFICDYQKGNTYCYNYYGISYWTADDCEKLQRDFSDVWNGPEGHDYFWEFIPLVLKKERYQVEIRPCRKQDIVEIDNYYELAELDPSYPAEAK